MNHIFFRSIFLFSTLVAIVTMSGCSSSTSPSGGNGNGSGGFIAIPSTINFGSLPVGEWHDTTISLVNSGTSLIIITSDSLSSGEVSDTNFAHPILIAAPRVTCIRIQFNPTAVGAQSATDRINYTSGGTNGSVTIALSATGVEGVSSTSPKAGSTFTYAVDTSGVPQGDSTYTVVSNSLTFQGKTNVLEVRGPTGDLNYYHTESNGDISIYLDLSSYSVDLIALGVAAEVPSTWVTIPLGSKRQVSNVLFDSSLTIQGSPVPIQVIISDTGMYLGATSVTAAGKSFPTVQGSMSLAINATIGGIYSVFSAENETEIWYSNTIGYYVKRQDIGSSSQNGLGTPTPPTTTTTNYKMLSYKEN